MRSNSIGRFDLFYKQVGPLLGLLLCALPAGNARAQAVETFVLTGSMTIPRQLHTATLLKDGRVLVAGGFYNPYPSPNPSGLPVDFASAELYDPATGSFSPTGSMITARERHSATLLPDGRVLIAGGLRYGVASSRDTTYLASAELYDPATGTFTPTGNMIDAQGSHKATLLNNGKVLISGGYGRGETRAELYDPATGLFSPVDMWQAGSTATPLLNGEILIAGGNYASTAALYDPMTNTADALGFLARPHPIGGHTATLLLTGKVLIAGGSTPESYGDDVLPHAELYVPGSGTFETTTSLLIARAAHTATLLPGGLLLIAGGYGNSDVSIAELFDPYNETFKLTGRMTANHENHTATLLGNGTVLITGGNTSSAELYLPPLPPTLTFDRGRVRLGDSFTATFSGTSLSDETYYDLRFRAPGDSRDQMALNWQRNLSGTHRLATDTPTGTWTITGVRPHQNIDDHTAAFVSVSAELLVTQ